MSDAEGYSELKVPGREPVTFPHCEPRVLHAPGECKFCDLHPDWQELRKTWGISFTGHSHEDITKISCPAESARGMHSINAWGGNRPVEEGEDVPDYLGMETAEMHEKMDPLDKLIKNIPPHIESFDQMDQDPRRGSQPIVPPDDMLGPVTDEELQDTVASEKECQEKGHMKTTDSITLDDLTRAKADLKKLGQPESDLSTTGMTTPKGEFCTIEPACIRMGPHALHAICPPEAEIAPAIPNDNREVFRMLVKDEHRDECFEYLLQHAQPKEIYDIALADYLEWGNDSRLTWATSLLDNMGAEDLIKRLWKESGCEEEETLEVHSEKTDRETALLLKAIQSLEFSKASTQEERIEWRAAIRKALKL